MTTEKKKKTTYKDVEIEFYCNGLAGVRLLALNEDLSRSILVNASESLAARGQDVVGLDNLITELHGEAGSGKGRTPPKNGDVRTYKAQQVKDGGPFGRIPLETLGVGKGESCNVAFCATEEDLPSLGEGPFLVIRAGAAPTMQEEPEEVEDQDILEGDDAEDF